MYFLLGFQLIEEMAKQYHKMETKHVLHLVSVTVPPGEIDVNLEPNKTKVLLKNMESVEAVIRNLVGKYYGLDVVLPVEKSDEIPAKRAKLDDDVSINDSLCSQINRENFLQGW